MHFFKAALLSMALTAGGAALTASAEGCDLSKLPCWDGGKCNIKFKNHTGKAKGSGRTPYGSQQSLSQTIYVSARKENGEKTGNKLAISDTASKTMNLEKKKNFSKIRITPSHSGTIDGTTIYCGTIKAILRGKGHCNIFYLVGTDSTETLTYSCNNKAISEY